MNDASISVMNNISEGFLRRSDPDLLQFLRYSAASNGEVRACYYAANGRRYLSDEETAELAEESNVIGRMLTRWQQSTRAAIEQRRRSWRTKA